MEDFKPPLDTISAAAYTGLAASTLEKLRVYGGGPRYLKLRRLVRYRPADLDDWLAERIVSSTSEPFACDRRRGARPTPVASSSRCDCITGISEPPRGRSGGRECGAARGSSRRLNRTRTCSIMATPRDASGPGEKESSGGFSIASEILSP